ncbi:MAG: DUF4249 domain-containing protein [Flavobacterium sp.]
MKTKNIILPLILLFTFAFWSCEEVVNIPLNTANPKLVVEASILWEKGTTGNEQKIKLTTTGDFYDNDVPKVLGATVTVKNSKGTIFNFAEIPNTGEYACHDFVPELNETYTLEIVTNGVTYTATETLKPVAPIKRVEYEDIAGFDENMIGMKCFFDDPADEENFYLFREDNPQKLNPEYFASTDEFFNGNEYYSLAAADKTFVGDQIKITHIGISKTYFNYVNLIISLAGNQGGGPFQTPPITAKGNVINTQDNNNNALGFFSLSETSSILFTIPQE